MIQRLYSIASAPQVGPEWRNFDGTPTIYHTSDPGLNIVSLAFTNKLRNTITLPAGTPVAYGSLPAGQSAIYIFFEGMLSNAEVDAIHVTALSGVTWNTATFQDSGGFSYVVLAPTAAVQIVNGAGLEFRVANILSTSSDFSGSAYITFVGAEGVDPPFADTQVYVNVTDQPVVGDQDLELLVGFAGSDLVFTGGQSNELTLYLTNPNPTALVPDGAKAWGPLPPTFQLSLVFGDSAGALTTVTEASSIAVNLGETFGNVWKPVAKQAQGSLPTWIMQPDPNGGGTVLGTGAEATVSFDLSQIISQLPQGLTYAYLAYSNIPGYNSGFCAVELLKVDPIVVEKFTATPASLSGQSGPAQVALDFEVRGASFVTITNTGYAKATNADDFADSVAATLCATTTYTLIANNFATGQVLSFPLTVVVSAPDLLAGSLSAGSAAISGQISAGAGAFGTKVRIDGPGNSTPSLSIGDSGTLAVDAPNVPGGRFLVLENSNVGINQPNPGAMLDVNGNARITGGVNVSNGAQVTGGLGVSNGAQVTGGMTVSDGAQVTGAVSLAPASDLTQGVVGIGGTVSANVALYVANTQPSAYGIYVMSPASTNNYWAMAVQGSCINTTGSWYHIADSAVQEDVRTFTDGLAQLLKINPVTYRLAPETDSGQQEHVGLVAQELQKVAPYMVGSAKLTPDSDEGHLAVDDKALTYMLLNAVKELASMVQGLENRASEAVDTAEVQTARAGWFRSWLRRLAR